MFLVLLLGYLTYEIIKPFLSAIAWAIVLSVVFYPVYAFLLKYLKWRPLSSAITLFLIILIVFGPFSYLSYLLTQELNHLIEHLKKGDFDSVEKILRHPVVRISVDKLLAAFHMTEDEFLKKITENIAQLGKESTGIIKVGLGNVFSGLINLIFTFLSIFFLLEDGPKFLDKLSSYMPFEKNEKDRLIRQVKDIVVSTIYGGVTVAILQGIIGGIAFSVLGISSPVLWGLAMFMTSFVPMLGTFIVWGPAAGFLFLNGYYIKAVILILIGVLVISMVDNILRPMIIKGKMRMPILAIFFSILGGINMFGLIGFILGPLVLALFISVIEIWRYTEEERLKNH